MPGRLAGMVNDSENGSSMCNSKMKLLVVNNYPRMCLFATQAIVIGEELRYDYGEDPKKLPWVILVLLYFLFLLSSM